MATTGGYVHSFNGFQGDVTAGEAGVLAGTFPGGTTEFLRADGTFAVPGGGGSGLTEPSGDNTGTTDTANLATALETGYCKMAPGVWYIKNVTLASYEWLDGCGRATEVNIVSGITGYGIALANTSVVQTKISNFALYCNSVCGGIDIDNSSEFPYPDPQHTLVDLFVFDAEGDAYHFPASLECRFTRLFQYGASGYGFYTTASLTDSRFTDCSSGPAGLHGFEVAAWNSSFMGCKAFYSGKGASFDTTHSGWHVTGNNNMFVACSGQQNALHGFDVEGGNQNTFVACEADHNSCGAATAGVGFNFNGATNTAFVGCIGDNTGSTSPGDNLYGSQINGTQTGTQGGLNPVSGTDGVINVVGGTVGETEVLGAISVIG
jgi:hypothetical protein